MSEKIMYYIYATAQLTDCQEQELRFHLFLGSFSGKLSQKSNSKTLPLIEADKGGLLKKPFLLLVSSHQRPTASVSAQGLRPCPRGTF